MTASPASPPEQQADHREQRTGPRGQQDGPHRQTAGPREQLAGLRGQAAGPREHQAASGGQKAGLRERKKAKTRAAIREHAMRLFEEQGYPATTVDQIAEAAEVSPSTFFRYFPTKEDVVLADDVDVVLIEAVRAQPAGVPPIEAIRRGMRSVFDDMLPEAWEFERRRQRLLLGVPELRARMLHQMTETIDLVAAVIAERAGLPAGDFSARVTAGAAVGAMLAVLPAGRDGQAEAVTLADHHRLEQALTLLQNGLPLGGDQAGDQVRG